ncbi:MAG TPA: protoporphyrinogen oxidase [Terracidiphilus sp.]|jgi:oxygen-dependent protoporphyrinogen oxidase|nr:protoporphyrinogen oxidase [Terracidiphilus sp.]
MRRIAIVGGGIAGLTAAYEIVCQARAGAPIEAVLFEASNRLGGLIETVREGGFTVECGPDGWVSAKPWARELATELGLASELIPSNDAGRQTWILLSTPENPAGRLVPMPSGLQMMVPTDLAALDRSPLLTDVAIAAYRSETARAAELRAAAPKHDESVADFTLRHFGPEVLQRVAAPLLSGVFGGDVRRLSVRAVMPAYVAMEREHGSLIAALSRTSNLEPRPSSIFTTLRTGLGTLVDRLVAAIPQQWLRTNTAVTAIQYAGAMAGRTGWTVVARAGKQHSSEAFDAVFLGTPLEATRQLLSPLSAAAAQLLPTESSAAVLVAFCYADAARVPLPPGFGFLVPPRSSEPELALDPSASLLLACTFVDQKFAHRVPHNGHLIRAFFGGTAADRIARCNNDEIAAIARLELARALRASTSLVAAPPAPPPVLTVVRRWPNSLPQYAVGHPDRAAELEAHLRGAFPGLALLGNALHGVGLPDLIHAARQAARAAAGPQ